MRLEAQSATLRDAYPAEYADLAVFVTDLGGTTVLMILLAGLFWLSRRRESALVLSYAFAGVGFVLALKVALDMPRPPDEVFLVPLDDDRYGFPSGHAFAATIVYGGILSAFELTRNRVAVLVVASLVAAISLSRVVIGFHYLGDVIAGVAIGIAFLAVMSRVCRGRPKRGFALGIGTAVLAFGLAGADSYTLLALGGSIGGLVGATQLQALPELRSRFEGAVLVVVGSAFVGGLRTLESSVTAFEPAVVGLYAVLVVGLVLAPAAVGRLPLGRVP